MKTFLFLFLISSLILAQDKCLDGKFKIQTGLDFPAKSNIDNCNCDVLHRYIPSSPRNQSDNPLSLSFSLFWSAPPGAFSNCNDGWSGYLDNDSLLDVVGYTFNPNMLYIWEQVATKADSFSLVYTYTKQEFGGFGPIAVGDLDGDGKMDIAVADYSTLSRIYIISNTGNNTYVSRETQGTLTHSADNTSAQSLLIGDMNKNGQKEIIINRGGSSPTAGTIRIWEHTGGAGTFTFNNIYNYSTVSYLFGKSGIGDSDGDGYDEVFLTYGGYDIFNTNIRRIKYDSASASFSHQIFAANTLGFPSSYRVADLYNDGHKELVATVSSNGRAGVYIYKSNGPNSYLAVDSMFETSDPNTMMISDIKILSGDIYPTILTSSFISNIYMYQNNGTNYTKQYQVNTGLGSATFRVYWLPWSGYDGFFHTWSSTSSNGVFYLYKRNSTVGVQNQNSSISKFQLNQNYPNPYNPTTKILYALPTNGKVILRVYDIEGRFIKELVNKYQQEGAHSVEFNGIDLPSGVYLYKIQFGDYTQTRKMVLVK